jgi:hypothetical protein
MGRNYGVNGTKGRAAGNYRGSGAELRAGGRKIPVVDPDFDLVTQEAKAAPTTGADSCG